jgi:hypothetical protein
VRCGLWVDAHATNRIDGGTDSGFVSGAMLATAGPRLAAMMMASVSRAMSTILIQLRHKNSPAP